MSFLAMMSEHMLSRALKSNEECAVSTCRVRAGRFLCAIVVCKLLLAGKEQEL